MPKYGKPYPTRSGLLMRDVTFDTNDLAGWRKEIDNPNKFHSNSKPRSGRPSGYVPPSLKARRKEDAAFRAQMRSRVMEHNRPGTRFRSSIAGYAEPGTQMYKDVGQFGDGRRLEDQPWWK